jgi:cytidylate kinase
MKPTNPMIITISRQLGCGGAYIGQKLAKKLKFRYADREIIRSVAEKLSVREEDIEMRDEKRQSIWESMMNSTGFAPEFYVPLNVRYAPSDAELYETETKIIEEIAAEGGAVIIGRGGFYILRNRPSTIRILLHADIDFRIKRVAELYKVSAKKAAEMVQQSDKDRAKYINALTGTSWMDATLFDLAIDTGRIGIEKAVDVISAFVKNS